jgi:hypothetical protein
MLQNGRDAGYYRFAICQQTNGGLFEDFFALNNVKLIKLVFVF